MTLEELIQQQIDAGKTYTNAEKNEWYETEYLPKLFMYSKLLKEGYAIFHAVEFNSDGVGGKLGDNNWSNKFVKIFTLADGSYCTQEEIDAKMEPYLKLKAFW
jgi:hypothetical protein